MVFHPAMRYCERVPRQMKTALLVLIAASTAASQAAVPAVDLKSNYQSIIERNPFGLRDPVVPKPPEPAPEKKPEVEYLLTGITSIGHPAIPRRAYIMTREKGNKKPNFYALEEENMESDGIDVLSIDPEKGQVRVNTPDGEMTLSFKTHGVKAPEGAARNMAVAAAAGASGAVPPPPGSPGSRYTRRMPGRPTAGNPNTANGYDNGRGGLIPPRTVRTRGGNNNFGNPSQNGSPNPQVPGQPQQEAPPPIDPAEQYINLRLQEEAARQQGIPFPPVPPMPQ